MASAEWEVQQDIYSVLRNDATVKTLVGDPARVYDHVLQDPTFPYIVIGEAITVDESTFAKFGQEHTVDVDSWSQYRGLSEVKRIMSAIQGALHEATFTLSGFVHGGTVQIFSQALNDPDGLTRHGVQTFKVVTLET